jgi:hypothetical protein
MMATQDGDIATITPSASTTRHGSTASETARTQ